MSNKVVLKKGVTQSMFGNMSKCVDYRAESLGFSTFYVDILCTKSVENAVEI